MYVPFFTMETAPKDKPIIIVDEGHFYGFTRDNYAAIGFKPGIGIQPRGLQKARSLLSSVQSQKPTPAAL